MVISLDDQNPTQLLLSCIRESGLAETPSSLKDDLGFVLGVVEDGEVTFHVSSSHNGYSTVA